MKTCIGPFIANSEGFIAMVIASTWRRVIFSLLASSPAILAAADEPKEPPASAAEARQREAAEVAQALRESWPDHPEWVDMLTGILEEEPMGPDFGWFRTARTQTRFDWDATRRRYDRDGDGRVSRRECPADDADFARLDRNHDGALTAPDFDFSGSSLAPSPGSTLFARVDRDGNGKVTREEFEAFFRASDGDGQGFLSLSDLQEALAPPPSPPAGSGRPSKATLVRGLFRREIGSLEPGPKLDDSAPDFTLKTNDGKDEVTLSKLIGPRPVVLVFGSSTCGPFRSQTGNIEKLYRRYKDRATFVMVYVREAHPTDGWRTSDNDRPGVVDRVASTQPRTYDERAEVARTCGRLLELSFPMLVDTIDDKAGNLYSGMPGRLYVIDREGKVAFKSGRGPYLFKPAELEQSLILLLREGQPPASHADASARPVGEPRPTSTVGAGQASN
jgi:Ca2+-binding EF-hand superfamily protein